MINELEVDAAGVSRRSMLKRGAIVGAAAVWTVPLVQAVSMTPAHAESPSAPGQHNDAPPPPTSNTAPTSNTPQSDPARATGQLPNTGTDHTSEAAVLGVAAVVLGAGAVAAAQYRRSREEDPEASTD